MQVANQFVQPPKKKEKTKDRETQKHKKEQVHCLQGVNPVLPQEEGPLHGTLANDLFAFWDVIGHPMNGTGQTKTK